MFLVKVWAAKLRKKFFGELPLLFACLAALPLILCATQFWSNKDSAQWTANEIERLLSDSPWAKQVGASFDNSTEEEEGSAAASLPGAAQTGMANGRGVSDGKWDGGVSRTIHGGAPSLRVLVRWDSALPVREALLRSQAGGNARFDQVDKDYIVTVMGLVPGGAAQRSGQNPVEMLKGLIARSALLRLNKPVLRPDDVQLDASTGAVHFFFPRKEAITASDKEVLFVTHFGSIRVEKSFRLKDMMYRGKLEL